MILQISHTLWKYKWNSSCQSSVKVRSRSAEKKKVMWWPFSPLPARYVFLAGRQIKLSPISAPPNSLDYNKHLVHGQSLENEGEKQSGVKHALLNMGRSVFRRSRRFLAGSLPMPFFQNIFSTDLVKSRGKKEWSSFIRLLLSLSPPRSSRFLDHVPSFNCGRNWLGTVASACCCIYGLLACPTNTRREKGMELL